MFESQVNYQWMWLTGIGNRSSQERQYPQPTSGWICTWKRVGAMARRIVVETRGAQEIRLASRTFHPEYLREWAYTLPNIMEFLQLRTVFLLLCLLWATASTYAQEKVELTESVLTATFADRTISALVTHLEKHEVFKRMVVLFPGHPSIMKIESADSFGMKGNFLIRSRHHWLDQETLVLSVDAPTDQWCCFTGRFRASKRYAEDLQGLMKEATARFGKLPWVLAGTSEGSVSVYFAALALQEMQPQSKVIFTSSLFNSSSNSQGLASLNMEEIHIPMLWMHHAKDSCKWTPYWQAKRQAEKTQSALVTVYPSSGSRGNACEAFSEHGFIGYEKEAVQAMKHWVLTGQAQDLGAP